MRQLHVQVRPEWEREVLKLANEHEAFSPTAVRARREDGEEWTMVFLNLPNHRVGSFIWAVKDEVEDAQFVIVPQGVLPIQAPFTEVHPRLRNVGHRSTLELVLDSLQSIGSWKGMLLYALFSGVVAAYGVLFSTSFLLVAAMLIAPMGAPIMVVVVGVSIGDWRVVLRGTLRFLAAILVLAASAAALGYAYGLSFSTSIMESITALSSWGVAVALVAGAAGAQSQVQSDRSSLVTGTATGFLIAAALSPTSAVLGLSVTLQRWDYTALMAFQLALQFAAIVTGGVVALLLYGVGPSDPTTGRGSRPFRAVAGVLLAVAAVGLVWWQTRNAPTFLKADLSLQTVEIARTAVESIPETHLIEARAHFTRPDLEQYSREGLLVSLVVRHEGNTPEAELKPLVRAAMEQRLREEMPKVIPFVDVSVLPGIRSAR